MRRILICLGLLTHGCAWVFMQKPEDSYAPDTQPQCSDSAGWAVLDGVFAILGATNVVAAAAAPDEFANPSAAMIGGAVDVLIFGLSAATGIGWARHCREAKADYEGRDQSGITAAEESQRRVLEKRFTPPLPDATAVAVQPALAPRGFFCSTSTGNAAAGFCVRDKAECQRTRDVAIIGVADLTECTLTEQAWCSGDRCSPTQEICERPGDGLACVQTK